MILQKIWLFCLVSNFQLGRQNYTTGTWGSGDPLVHYLRVQSISPKGHWFGCGAEKEEYHERAELSMLVYRHGDENDQFLYQFANCPLLSSFLPENLMPLVAIVKSDCNYLSM